MANVADYIKEAKTADRGLGEYVVETVAKRDRWTAYVEKSTWGSWVHSPNAYGVEATGSGGLRLSDVVQTDTNLNLFATRLMSNGVRVLVQGSPFEVSRPGHWNPKPSLIEWPDELVEESQSSVQVLANRVKETSGLTDEQLAAVFPGGVTRETVNRWRNGREERPSASNLRMLGLLERLLNVIKDFQPVPRTWLLATVGPGGLSPYDLLVQGRLAEVSEVAARLAHDPHAADTAWIGTTSTDEWSEPILLEDDYADWDDLPLDEDD